MLVLLLLTPGWESNTKKTPNSNKKYTFSLSLVVVYCSDSSSKEKGRKNGIRVERYLNFYTQLI